MGRRVDEAEWLERRSWVERQAASGLSVVRFCGENGLNLSNFRAWKRRIDEGTSRSLLGDRTEGGHRRERVTNAFLRVPIAAESQFGSHRSWVEISLATGMVVRVPADNPSALRTVLQRLQEDSGDA